MWVKAKKYIRTTSQADQMQAQTCYHKHCGPTPPTIKDNASLYKLRYFCPVYDFAGKAGASCIKLNGGHKCYHQTLKY